MPVRTAMADARKCVVRTRVEQVFAQRKDRMEPFVRTIGLTEMDGEIGLVNLAYNLQSWLFSQRRMATG